MAENPFYGARLKVQRAKELISELHRKGQAFADGHPHVITVETDGNTGHDRLKIAPADPFPHELLLILGDALHNLRTGLDHAWFQMVTSDPKYRKFPVRESREGVEAAINGLKDNAVDDLKKFILDVLQPYRGGKGQHILDLHELDIEDKHSLLIAHRQFTMIQGMIGRDSAGEEFAISDWLIVPPHTASEPFEGHSRFKLVSLGQARTHATFGDGMPLQGHYILPTLHNFTKLISGVIDCFESIHKANSK